MEDMLASIKEAIKNKEGKVEFKGLMSLRAGIKEIGETDKDVLGWFTLFRRDGKCMRYYHAQYPLIGMTLPVEVMCPLGIRTFDSYKVDFKEALKKMKELKCGDKFVALSLYWPLTPECVEPYWHIRTNLGNQIAVGANSGKTECYKSSVL
jgi:hypothetical protein